MTFRPLREHPPATLNALNEALDDLLVHRDAIPPELFIKLDTFRADIAAAIEDTTPPRHLRAIRM